MKRALFFIFLIGIMAMLSLCAFATETGVEATGLEDITGAIENAQEGDTVKITLLSSIEFDQSIEIKKAITVDFDFNGFQLNYKGSSGKDTSVAGFRLANAGAILNLNGSNPLTNAKEYTHYGDGVTADMVGTGNLIGVDYGTVNIKNAYLYATNDTYVIYTSYVSSAQACVFVDGSVLRIKEGSDTGAICYRGGNNNSANGSLIKKVLVLNNSVEYGGFKGHDCSFNLTDGSAFTSVKFYDFVIKNDSWLSNSSLYLNSFEKAIPFYHCVFKQYDEQTGDIRIKTETGKHNIKIYDCEYSSVVNAGKFSGDSGGTAHVFIVEKMPNCVEDGSAYSYSSPRGTPNTNEMSTYKKESFKLGKSGHTLEETEKIVYENGYANKGKGVKACTVCKENTDTGSIFDSLFVNLGTSLNEEGNSICFGLRVNKKELDTFLSNTEKSFDFGIVAGNKNLDFTLVDGKISAQNGYLQSFSQISGNYFDLKISGFTDTSKNIEFVAEFYACDGYEITFIRDNPKEKKTMTFNGIVDELNEVNQAVTKLLESKHKLYYNEDGSFRAMILADLHIAPNSDTTQLKERIKMLVDKENPNLVIFTGDNTWGAKNEQELRHCLDSMVSYLEEKEIPWCHVYGNHDREAGMTNQMQQEIYESYNYCISKDEGGDDVWGVGNYVHGVYKKDGTLGSVIYFLDSGTGNSQYSYDYIHEDQIAWYKQTSELLQKYNNGVAVKGIMAFHIPLLENQRAFENVNNKEMVYEVTGERFEAICPSYYDTNMFETILERGDVQAIVTGHDHSNDYMYNYYGVKLCSAPTISKLGYSFSDTQEGARMFDLNTSTLDNIKTYVSYLIERVNPDDFGTFENNKAVMDFAKLEGTGYDNGALNGSFTAEVIDGKIKLLRSASGNGEMNFVFDKGDFGKIGENKYLIVKVDFTGVDFRKACFGILSTAGTIPYRTDDYDRESPFYYLADGTQEWVEINHGNDGCFGNNQNSPMLDKKGYLALPIEYFRCGGKTVTKDTLITGIYFYCDVNTGAGTPFYFENFKFVEDYTQFN